LNRGIPVEKLVTLPSISPKPKVKKQHRNSANYGYGRKSDAEFENYVKDKRVIIVGPAGYLQGQQKGEWIDSFDVVIRINHAVPVANTEDYGKRTDVLYHIFSHRGSDGRHKTLIEEKEVKIWKAEKVKWVVSRHDPLSARVKQVQRFLSGNVDWIALHQSIYTKLKACISSKNPNTGILAMYHLLKLPIQSLHIVGFDFYRSGVFSGYGDLREGECAEAVNSRWHDTDAQLQYISRLNKQNAKLFLDSVLEGML